jgi:hypothetical protein
LKFLNDIKTWGGLNLDDSDLNINFDRNGSRLPYTDYRNAKNIRVDINAINRGRSLVNIQGNLPITKITRPYPLPVLPATKRCIGAVEDVRYSSIIFFLWSSDGNHEILRYWRNRTDPNNPYGVIEQVMLHNFGWTQDVRKYRWRKCHW